MVSLSGKYLCYFTFSKNDVIILEVGNRPSPLKYLNFDVCLLNHMYQFVLMVPILASPPLCF